MRQLRTVLVAGMFVLSACGGGGETAATDAAVTVAPTIAATTTTELPWVTPTDNDGLLYRVESAPWFGGFELHIVSRGIRYGFVDTPAGAETSSEMLLRFVLWTFASQHSQFVAPDAAGYTTAGGDDQVDIDGYVALLEANDWVDDEVYVPVTVGVGRDLVLVPQGEAGVEQSPAFRLDFKQPFIISNDDLAKLDGVRVGEPNFLFPNSDHRTDFGVTENGQLYFSIRSFNDRGFLNPLPIDARQSYPFATRLGEMLMATSRITHPEASPQEQWGNPARYYNNLWMVKPESLFPPYPVLNLFELVEWDPAAKTWINKLFAPITPP